MRRALGLSHFHYTEILSGQRAAAARRRRIAREE
jgi:hypothetical protein